MRNDDPQTDDSLDAWIASAQRTHRSVTIYRRADLIADLDDLDRRIQIARENDDQETVNELEPRWVQVATEFSESGLLVKVRGLHESEFRAIRAQATVDGVDERTLGAMLMAAAIVEPAFTTEQLLRLEERVGEPQISRIVSAYLMASREQPPTPVIETT